MNPIFSKPLSWLYRCAVEVHKPGISSIRAPLPVVSVGNLEVGGTGKSPIAQAICAGLERLGCRPAILSRGYGGRLKATARVVPEQHKASDCGDEPLMHALDGYRVYIGGDRHGSAVAAAADGVDICVLDDGHATKSVVKDFSILVFRPGFSGRRALLPAGRLREPLETGLARSDYVIVNGSPTRNDNDVLAESGLPFLTGEFVVQPPLAERGSQPVVLVTGIANPDRVFKTAHRLGYSIAHHLAFPDHHRFRPSDLAQIQSALTHHQATVLTTSKDAVRLPPILMENAEILKGTWQASDQEQFRELLARLVSLRGVT